MRRWISFLAVLGVLLHAGAVVRHHVVMLGTPGPTGAEQALLANLQAICHGAGGQENRAATDGPSNQTPADVNKRCPLCAGVVGLFALLTPEPALAVRLAAASRIFAGDTAVQVVLPRTLYPPTRGPPYAV